MLLSWEDCSKVCINCQLYFVCLYPVILVYELSILDRSCDTDVMVCTQLVIDLLQ